MALACGVTSVLWYLCAWRSPCIPRTAAAEPAGRSDTPRLRARRCPRYGCLRRWRPLPAARQAQRLPADSQRCVSVQRRRRILVCLGHLFCSPTDVRSSYLRLLSLGFALLGRLHLLVVVLDKTRRQHIELLHPQRSGPLLGLLICYLPQTTGSVLILSGIWILLQ